MALPAELAEAQAQVDVRVPIVELRIEPARLRERLAADQHAAAGDGREPSRPDDRGVIGGEPRIGAVGEPVLPEHEAGVPDGAVGGQQPGADDPGPRVGVGVVEERVQPAGMRERVAVQEDQIRTRRAGRTRVAAPGVGAVQEDRLDLVPGSTAAAPRGDVPGRIRTVQRGAVTGCALRAGGGRGSGGRRRALMGGGSGGLVKPAATRASNRKPRSAASAAVSAIRGDPSASV